MKQLYIIANWKSNKTASEIGEWFDSFKNQFDQENVDLTNKEIIICPSFPFLKLANDCVSKLNLPLKIGAQNISQYGPGAHTGEVNGEQLKGIAEYVIIGHSERRTNFNESNDDVSKKISMAKNYGINPILCVQDENTEIPEKVSIVAYEPPSAIGTGNPDTPENAESVASKIRQEGKAESVLYGGSVTSENASSFSSMENISGFLIGGASLDPLEFLGIVKNA